MGAKMLDFYLFRFFLLVVMIIILKPVVKVEPEW